MYYNSNDGLKPLVVSEEILAEADLPVSEKIADKDDVAAYTAAQISSASGGAVAGAMN